MQKEFIIWGIYGDDKLESLICAKIDGKPITTRQDAEKRIAVFERLIQIGQLHPVRDWRIAEIDLSTKPDFAATVAV
jgi:hypothetical protein